MTASTRWFVKTGMGWLILSMLLLLFESTGGIFQDVYLSSIAWHLMAIGWITQIIIGVAIWMFPSAARGRRIRETVRIWSVYWMLNIGLLFRLFSDLGIGPGGTDTTLLIWFVSISASLQTGAVLLFVLEIWPRVRGKRKPVRSGRRE